jgi:hypothetical protein
VEAARLDGEAVVLGVDGIADFNASTLAGMTMRSSFAPSTLWPKVAKRHSRRFWASRKNVA